MTPILIYHSIIPLRYYPHNNKLIEFLAANLFKSFYAAGNLTMFFCVVTTDLTSFCYLVVVVALTYTSSWRSAMKFRCSDRVLQWIIKYM